MSDPYTLPGTDTLRNKLGIIDPEELLREEYWLTEERLVEFEQFPTTKAFDLEDLRHVHRRMFCDIYEWAGELRTTWIRKREHESGGRLTRFTEPENLVSRGAEVIKT
jgi:cell filamentation protein